MPRLTSRLRRPIPLIMLSFSALLPMLPGLATGPSLDASVFILVAKAMAGGGSPYVSVWDHKPPGTYLALVAVHWLVPWTTWWQSAWILTLSSIVASGVIVFGVLRRWIQVPPALLAALFMVLIAASFPFSLGGGMTESIGLALAAGGFALTTDAKATVRRVVLGGAFAGSACLVSLLFMPLVPSLIVSNRMAGRPRNCWIGWFCGLMAVPMIALAWLALTGSLQPSIDALLAFNTAYRSDATDEITSASLRAMAAAILMLAVLWLPVALNLRFLLTPRPAKREVLVASSWLVLALVFLSVAGRLYLHYLTVLLVPLAILFGATIRISFLTQRRTMAAAVLVVSTALSAGVIVEATLPFVDAATSYAASVRQLASRLGTDERAGSLFVWGSQPQLYVMTHSEPATSYVYLFPMQLRGYSGQSQVRTGLSELERARPPVIVDGSEETCCSPSSPSLRRHDPRDGLNPLRDWIAAKYYPSDRVGKYVIYRPREPG